jgi:DNA-binding beta-propeller fold protein YncE
LRDAYDIAIDRYGSFALVTDPGSSIIIKFSLEDWSDYSILCGVNNTSGFVNGGFTVNKLFDPRGVVISRDTSFALFTDNNAVRKVFISSGDVATVVGNGVAGYADGNLSSGAMFSQPGGLAFLSSSFESSIVVRVCVCAMCAIVCLFGVSCIFDSSIL